MFNVDTMFTQESCMDIFEIVFRNERGAEDDSGRDNGMKLERGAQFD